MGRGRLRVDIEPGAALIDLVFGAESGETRESHVPQRSIQLESDHPVRGEEVEIDPCFFSLPTSPSMYGEDDTDDDT